MENINNTNTTNQILDNQQIIETPTFPKQNNIFKFLFFISLLILIGLVIYIFLFFKNSNQSIVNKIDNQTIENTTPSPTLFEKAEEETPDAKQILKDLQKSLNTTSPIEEYESSYPGYDLNINDKERVPIIGQKFYLCGESSITNCGVWGNFTNITEVTEESLKPLKTSVDNFLISNGFKKDIKNSYIKSNHEYISYTKGNLKCSIDFFYYADIPDIDLRNHFSYFYCGTTDQIKFNLKKELYSVINPTSSPDVFFEVGQVIGNYARGGIGTYSSGGGFNSWFAVKLNGNWKLVWTNGEQEQVWITCDIVDKYNIPKEINSGCYDNEKKEMRKF